MTTYPQVSIVTPSLNQGDYIERTITSVLEQDYPNIEYLVIDGGSSDNTLEILQRYDAHIRWISEPDTGQAQAINRGIGMAAGEILCWLNSDDVLLPSAVEKVVECFAQHPENHLIYGCSYFIDTSGKIVGRYPTQPFDYNRLAMFNFIAQPSAFLKKEVITQVGMLDESLHYAMDLDLWIRIAQKYSIAYIPEYLSAFRLHGESKTMADEHAFLNQKEGLDVVFKHFGWAPLNRVYGCCYQKPELTRSSLFRNLEWARITASLVLTLVKYVRLNRGIRLADMKAINKENLRKIRIRRSDLYKTY